MNSDLPLMRYLGMIWAPVTVRKDAECYLSKVKLMRGEIAYRPISNSSQRMLRISTPAMLAAGVRL